MDNGDSLVRMAVIMLIAGALVILAVAAGIGFLIGLLF